MLVAPLRRNLVVEVCASEAQNLIQNSISASEAVDHVVAEALSESTGPVIVGATVLGFGYKFLIGLS